MREEAVVGGAQASCLTYVAPGQVELRPAPLRLGGGDDLVVLQAQHSGISRGTERLVFNGKVPPSEHERMRGPFQHGDFPFPVGYGYSWVGHIHGEDGKSYFGLFPHQDHVEVPREALTALPEGLDPRRAVLTANMETALNIAWDSGAGPGDRISVVGGGVLGLLVAGVVSDIAGTDVEIVDIDGGRETVAQALGAGFATPDRAAADRDVVIHTSASEAGLATALSLAGTEATVVEASWFGAATPSVPLGGAFHSRRLVLKSSQVGMVSPSRRVRWSYKRRLEMAMRLLLDDKYDRLITGDVAFVDLPQRIGDILDPKADGLATAVSYL